MNKTPLSIYIHYYVEFIKFVLFPKIFNKLFEITSKIIKITLYTKIIAIFKILDSKIVKYFVVFANSHFNLLQFNFQLWLPQLSYGKFEN